ncbi:MAG: hypothetical protein ACFFBP_04485 [Promethearchaeota archaeon]
MNITIKDIKEGRYDLFLPQLYNKLNVAISELNTQSIIKLSKIITKCHIRGNL